MAILNILTNSSCQLDAYSVRGIVVNTLHVLIQFSQQPCQVSTTISPILYLRKLDIQLLSNLSKAIQQVLYSLRIGTRQFGSWSFTLPSCYTLCCKYLLTTYYIISIVLRTGDTRVNTDRVLILMGFIKQRRM